MTNKNSLQIGIGVFGLRFGMIRVEVEKILGQADREHETDTNDVELVFNDSRLVLRFDRDSDDKLCWINVYNNDVMLFGHKVIGVDKSDALNLVKSNINDTIDIDDFGTWDSYTFEKNWLELQFEFDKVTCVNFGVLIDENDKEIWPD